MFLKQNCVYIFCFIALNAFADSSSTPYPKMIFSLDSYSAYAKEANRYIDEVDRNHRLALVTTDVIAIEPTKDISKENPNKPSYVFGDERLVSKSFIKHPNYPLRTHQVFFGPKTYGTPSNPIQNGPHVLFVEIYEVLEEITLGPLPEPLTGTHSDCARALTADG